MFHSSPLKWNKRRTLPSSLLSQPRVPLPHCRAKALPMTIGMNEMVFFIVSCKLKELLLAADIAGAARYLVYQFHTQRAIKLSTNRFDKFVLLR